MKRSAFNIVVKDDEGDGMTLFNSYTGNAEAFSGRASLWVSDVLRDRYPEGGVLQRAQMRQLALRLYDHGYIIDDERDEHAELKANYDRRKYSDNTNGSWSITIAPTMACNLDCVYCYAPVKAQAMRRDTIELMSRRVREYVEANDIRSLSVAWIGGEPLVAYKQMRSICERLHGIMESRGGMFVTQLITNGTLMDEARAIELASAPMNTGTVQVTIDGYWHDSTRVTRGNKESDKLESVIRNTAIAHRYLNMVVRVNVPKAEFVDEVRLSEFLAELAARIHAESGKTMQFYIAGVHDATLEAKLGVAQEWNNRDLAKFSERVKNLVRSSAAGDRCDGTCDNCEASSGVLNPTERSIIGDIPGARTTGCGLEERDSICIGPQGFIYKCWHHISRDDKIIGHIQDPIDWRRWIASPEFRRVQDWSPYKTEMCMKCVVLPMCQGHCFDKGFDKGPEHTSRCSLFKWTIKDRVKRASATIREVQDRDQTRGHALPLAKAEALAAQEA